MDLSLTDSILMEILQNSRLMLQEIQESADSGSAIIRNGTVTTADFVIIDTQIAPGHPVKGFTVENTDTRGNNIYVGMNIAKQIQLDVDLIDIVKTNPVFNIIEPDESFEFKFNRNKVRSIHLLAVTGSPTYKAWLTW